MTRERVLGVLLIVVGIAGIWARKGFSELIRFGH